MRPNKPPRHNANNRRADNAPLVLSDPTFGRSDWISAPRVDHGTSNIVAPDIQPARRQVTGHEALPSPFLRDLFFRLGRHNRKCGGRDAAPRTRHLNQPVAASTEDLCGVREVTKMSPSICHMPMQRQVNSGWREQFVRIRCWESRQFVARPQVPQCHSQCAEAAGPGHPHRCRQKRPR